MPKIMPVAIQDKTADFILQMSQGNQALARLYTQLLARYEEARLSEDFKREMFEKGNAAWKERYDYQQNPQDESERHHPFGTGAPPAANAPPATAAPAARPQARPMPMIPGAAPIPGGDSFDRSSSAPVAPTSAPAGSVPATPGYDSFAQATSADHTDFSAQSRIGQPPQQQQQRTPRGTSRRVAPPIGQLPRGTSMDPPPRRARQPPAQAEFLPIQAEWLQKMHDAETKWKVPHGSVLAVYGFENSGGRFTGKNKHSTAAGIGQFTDELIREYKLDPSVRNDPNIMIDLIARNMSRNARVLERDFKIKLDPSNPQHMPFYTFMHQFGVTDGPLAVRQYLTNPNVPMTSIMANVKKRDGTPRNNAETLANNRIPSNSTVGRVIEQHASIVQPWYDNGLKLMSGVKPSAPATTTTPPAVAPQSQATPATPPTGTAAAATPPNAEPARVENVGPLSAIRKGPVQYPVKPHVQRLIDEFQQRYPSARITSTYRSPEYNRSIDGARNSQHILRTAFDFSLGGMPDAQRAEAINFLRARGAVGIGNYGGNSFHADLRTGSPNVAWGPNRSNTSLHRTPRWFQQIAQDHLGGRAPPAIPAMAVAAKTTTAPAATPPAGVQVQAQQVATRAPKPSEVFQSPNIKPTVDEPFKASDVTQSNRRSGLFDNTPASLFGVPVSPTLAGGPDIFTTSINEDPWRPTPVAKLASSTGGMPQAPRDNSAGLSGGLAARSDLDFTASGPPIAAGPSGVAARSDLDYNAVPPPAQREAPAVGPYEAAPEAPPVPPVEAPLMEQPQPSPLQAPMPDIAMSDAVPQASSPFDWPTEGMPQSPNIAGPPINLQGQLPNAPTAQADYPPPAFPQVAETSHNYDPNSRAGRRIDYARRQAAEAGPQEPTYMDQLIRSITDRGSTTPHLPVPPPMSSTIAGGDAPFEAVPEGGVTPPTLDAIKKAIYGSQITGGYRGTPRGQRDIREGRIPATKPVPEEQVPVPPSAIPPSSIFHERPQAVVPVGQGMRVIPEIPRNTHSIVADFQKMKEAIEQGRVPEGINTDYTPEVRYGARPPVGTPNTIIDKIKELAQRYAEDYQKNYYPERKSTLQSNIQQDAKKAKSQSYGADWMPKQLGAATAPTQQQDDLPPPVTAPPVIQKPGGSSQQPAQMPNMTPTTPPAPKPGSGGAASPTGGPQMMTGAQRKAAASAAAGPGETFSWVNDNNAVEFENNPP